MDGPEPVLGHSWKIEVALGADALGAYDHSVGFVPTERPVRARTACLHDRDIDTMKFFDAKNPSAENVAGWVVEEIHSSGHMKEGARLEEVTVWEGTRHSAKYRPRERHWGSRSVPSPLPVEPGAAEFAVFLQDRIVADVDPAPPVFPVPKIHRCDFMNHGERHGAVFSATRRTIRALVTLDAGAELDTLEQVRGRPSVRARAESPPAVHAFSNCGG